MTGQAEWWRDSVIYQIYPRSFFDANGDGVGDLRGITAKLDYLAWLGVGGIWLNPTYPSPNVDWGFDVTDYKGVHPELGTLEDMDELISAATRLGLRVLLDLVPNHTSKDHPWFSTNRDYYVWRQGREGGQLPPNNWRSLFGGPAWTKLDSRGQWYLHNYLPEQPDLDWWNPKVRSAFDEIMKFWLDRGVAGFRIDVASGIIKDRQLRDNPPPRDGHLELYPQLGLHPEFSMNRPEVHDLLHDWRSLAESYGAVLIGEVLTRDLATLAAYHGREGREELHMAFNLAFLESEFTAAALAPLISETERLLTGHAWPVWALGNHDYSRFPTRWTRGDEGLSQCALILLLTLRGTPIVYYGDELAMPETKLAGDAHVDRWQPPRDGARTPMPWSNQTGGGFTSGSAAPWLPMGDLTTNVSDQRADEESPLHLCRDLIALRRRTKDLRTGPCEDVTAQEGILSYQRGNSIKIALNLGSRTAETKALGRIAIATRRERQGAHATGRLALAPGEGVVVESAG